MEKYLKITVNGNVYDVKVEDANAAQVAPQPVVEKPVVQEVAKPVEAPKAEVPVSNATESIKVTAPMPGSVWKIKTSVGATVAKHEVLLILEAMKMENEIVAPEAGKVVAIKVAEGNTVEPGQVMIEME